MCVLLLNTNTSTYPDLGHSRPLDLILSWCHLVLEQPLVLAVVVVFGRKWWTKTNFPKRFH